MKLVVSYLKRKMFGNNSYERKSRRTKEKSAHINVCVGTLLDSREDQCFYTGLVKKDIHRNTHTQARTHTRVRHFECHHSFIESLFSTTCFIVKSRNCLISQQDTFHCILTTDHVLYLYGCSVVKPRILAQLQLTIRPELDATKQSKVMPIQGYRIARPAAKLGKVLT